MRYANDLIFDAVAVASTDTENSEDIDSSSMFQISAQAVVVGDAVGTLKMQGSNDVKTNSAQSLSYSDIANASVAVSGAAVYLIPTTDICYEYVRLTYTNASGTGTLSTRIKTNGY